MEDRTDTFGPSVMDAEIARCRCGSAVCCIGVGRSGPDADADSRPPPPASVRENVDEPPPPPYREEFDEDSLVCWRCPSAEKPPFFFRIPRAAEGEGEGRWVAKPSGRSSASRVRMAESRTEFCQTLRLERDAIEAEAYWAEEVVEEEEGDGEEEWE